MKKKLLVFIQKQYYRPKYEALLKNYSGFEILIIARDKVSMNGEHISEINTENFFRTLYELFKIRNIQYDVFLASNVDDRIFQLIFRYLQFKEFHSFDEGQRSLVKDDYYFAKKIPFKGQRKNRILNKIFGFPLPLMDYFTNSTKHYAFYDPRIFAHALSEHPNLQFQEITYSSKSLTKIFIGVSGAWNTDFQGGFLSKKSELYHALLLQAAHQINTLLPDIYLMHPRESENFINLLDDRISVLKNVNCGNETFLNKLVNSNNNIQIYVERTGLVFDLNQNAQINFINLFGRFSEESFQSFVDNFLAFREGKYSRGESNE